MDKFENKSSKYSEAEVKFFKKVAEKYEAHGLRLEAEHFVLPRANGGETFIPLTDKVLSKSEGAIDIYDFIDGLIAEDAAEVGWSKAA